MYTGQIVDIMYSTNHGITTGKVALVKSYEYLEPKTNIIPDFCRAFQSDASVQ